jgi:hypothetical protein
LNKKIVRTDQAPARFPKALFSSGYCNLSGDFITTVCFPPQQTSRCLTGFTELVRVLAHSFSYTSGGLRASYLSAKTAMFIGLVT